MTIWMFYGNFDDEENNWMDTTNIYNVERDTRLSPDLQQVVAWSTTSDNRKCVENPFYFPSGSAIVFS